MKILTICGSLRHRSFNRAICNTLPALGPDGCTLENAPSFAAFPVYNADFQESNGVPAEVTALAEAIRRADGVVIVSPEYNYSVPGGLKNALDWISRVPDQPFIGKPVALQSAAIGMLGGARMQYHLRQILVFLDARVFNKPEVFVNFAKTKVDTEGELLVDESAREAIRSQLAAFADQIRR
ncbi:MAG: NAD(P)H-dependent oxidoreductase [Rhodospirillales bacterium]|nr:NAD(P)H-dependent oxidoreductase [Rhodospirillales bacterium]